MRARTHARRIVDPSRPVRRGYGDTLREPSFLAAGARAARRPVAIWIIGRATTRSSNGAARRRRCRAPSYFDAATMPGRHFDAMGGRLAETAAIAGEYDYIIVGAGSAGCLFANRLSADAGKRVLLLEAGGRDNWIWFHIPVGYLFAIGNPRSDWCFKTEPVPGLNGRSLSYPRGKVIGGSSAINAMVYMRGQAADYDHWRQLGLTGWGWDDVLPFFKRHEDHFMGESALMRPAANGRSPRRACAGTCSMPSAPPPNRPASNRSTTSTAATTRASAPSMSISGAAGASSSATRFPQAGARPPQSAARNRLPGRRPHHRGKRAAGVRWRQDGARAARLQRRSDPRRGLARLDPAPPALRDRPRRGVCGELGIPVALARQGVGANLQDHLQLRLIYKVDGIETLNERYHSRFGFASMLAEYALLRRGPLTMAPSQLGVFTRSDADQERANLQYHVQPLSLDRFGEPLHDFGAFTASVCNLRPTSRGSVRLRSRDPAAPPMIQPNYLSTDADRRVAAEFDPPDAPYRGATGAGAVSSRRISAGRRRARRRGGAGQGRGRYRYHDLSSDRHRQDGTAERSDGGGRRAAARHRHRRAACGRCLGDADHHVGQHQCADDDDRREGGRHAARGRRAGGERLGRHDGGVARLGVLVDPLAAWAAIEPRPPIPLMSAQPLCRGARADTGGLRLCSARA